MYITSHGFPHNDHVLSSNRLLPTSKTHVSLLYPCGYQIMLATVVMVILAGIELLVLLSIRSLSGVFSYHGRWSSESRFSSKVQIMYSLSRVVSKLSGVFLNRDFPSMSEATKSNSNCLNCLGSPLLFLGNNSKDNFLYFVSGSVSQSMAFAHCHTRWNIFISIIYAYICV